MKYSTVLIAAFGLFLLLSSASSLVFVFRLFDQSASFADDPAVPRAISGAIQTLREPEKQPAERLDRVTREVLTIQRSYGRFNVEKKRLLIETLATFLVFLLIQAALLFALSYAAARLLTRPLSVIRAGLERIEKGETDFRFPALRGREIGLACSRLNHFLDVIRDKERRLAEQSRLLGWQEILSFMAHQIKNPLSAIAVAAKNVELSLLGSAKTAIIEDSLAILSRESQRVGELISRFRATVRFPELALESADMAALIAEAAAEVSADRARFLLDLDPGPRLSADKSLIRETLNNLFTNSIEASAAAAAISVTLRWEESVCRITVDDDARGVPPEIARAVLQTAFSTKPGGSGLGLLFVRKVVALHNGTIIARQAEDGGLVFEIRMKGGDAACPPSSL